MTTAYDSLSPKPLNPDTISVSTQPQLCAGLVVAQGAVGRVSKEGKNAYHHYAYATAEDMIDEARTALNKGCLALIAVTYDTEIRSGTMWLRADYALIHTTGEAIRLRSETPVIPEKGRPEDKALAAAKTFDLAYLLRTLLLIPRGDQEGGKDHGVDARDDSRAERPRAAPKAQAQAQAQAQAPSPKLLEKRRLIKQRMGEISELIGGAKAREIWGHPKTLQESEAALVRLEEAAALHEAAKDPETPWAAVEDAAPPPPETKPEEAKAADQETAKQTIQDAVAGMKKAKGKIDHSKPVGSRFD